MEEHTASIARNAKAMMGAQVITWAASFILMLFLPRYLGAEDYGRLVYAVSFNAITAVIMDLGLTILVVKEIARDHSVVNRLLWNGGALRVIVWAISLIATILFVLLSGYPPRTVHVVLILGVANLFYGLYDLIHRVFVGLEQSQYRSVAIVAEKVFLSVGGVTMLLLGYDSVVIATVMLISILLNLTVSVFLLKANTDVRPQIELSTWVPIFRSGLPFMISSMLAYIYYRVDVLMLSSMTNEAVVGWYGLPHRLLDTLMFFPVILTNAVFPVLSRMFHTSPGDINQMSRKILDVTIIVAIPLVVGMASLARPIISILGGLDQYSNSVIVLQILSISLLLVYIDFVFNTVILSHNRQRQAVFISLCATIVNLTINYFAIRYFHDHYGNGAIGAALTTGLTEVCVMGMSILVMPKGFLAKENIILAGKALLGGSVMWVTIWYVESIFHSWIVAGIFGSGVYLLMMFVLRVLTRQEVQFFLEQLPFVQGLAQSALNRERREIP